MVLAAPLLTAVYTLGNDKVTATDRDLITALAYLLLPEIFFYGLAGIFAAILNMRGHFAAPMWTPILNNLVVIATAGVFFLLPGPKALRRRRRSPSTQVLVLGIGTTLGIVVQAAGALAGAAPGRLPLEVAVRLPQAHLRELGQARRLDAALRRGQPDRHHGRDGAGEEQRACAAATARPSSTTPS